MTRYAHSQFVFLLYLVVAIFQPVWRVHADDSCAEFSPDRVVNTIQLSPAIPREASKGVDQVFYEQRLLVPFEAGMAVFLSGRQELAPVIVDDYIKIDVHANGQSFKHDFRNSDHTAIVPLDPVDLSAQFDGINSVTEISFQSRDLMLPEYRSSEIWLIVWQRCTPTPEPTETDTPTATATFTPLPTDTPIPPTFTATVTWTPEPTATITPMPTATYTEIAVIEAPVNATGPPLPWRVITGIGFLLLGTLAIVAWQLGAQARRPRGVFEVFEVETGAFFARYVLPQLGKAVVMVGAQGDVFLPELAISSPVARIYTRSEAGQRVTMVDLLAEADPNIVLQSIEAYDGLRLNFSPYVLLYQQQVAADLHYTIAKEQSYV